MRFLIPEIIKNYMPIDVYQKNQGEVFEMILDGVLTSGSLKQDKSTMHLVIDALLNSTRNENHYKMLIEWFDSGIITNSSGTKLEYCELSSKHKYEIVKRVHSAENIESPQKERLMKKLEEDKSNSDWLENCKSYCEAADPANKDKMWDLYFSGKEELKSWELHKFQNHHVGFNQP